MFDAEGELLPSNQQDRANFARCMTVAAQLTAQIKPISPDADRQNQSQTVNINFEKLSTEELEDYARLRAKLEGSSEGTGEEKAA